jgi:hypothetical protein
MRGFSRFWSRPSMLRSPSVVAMAAAGTAVVLAGSLPPFCEQAHADALCGPDESRYVDTVAAGLQQFVPKMTRSGRFAIKDEYPGNGSAIVVISFADHGKTLFVHRVAADKGASATVLTPGTTKGGDPGLSIALQQGNLGSCTYSVFVRDAKFTVIPRGLKR